MLKHEQLSIFITFEINNVCVFFFCRFYFIDARSNSVLKISSISRNRNGFWLDPTGMVWRQTELPKDQIADYAPVCQTPTIHRDIDQNG